MSKIINREQLLDLIKNAKKRVRILGAVSFDLPYENFKQDWLTRINQGTITVEIVCESEPLLQYYSLISSNKMVSRESRSYDIGDFLNIKSEPSKKLREFLIENNCKHTEPKEDAKNEEEQHFSLRTTYLPIQLPMINIDDDYYITQALTLFCTQNKFEHILPDISPWHEEYMKYFKLHFEEPLGGRKFSTEETKKDNRTEVIVMYNDERHILGQAPRDSFPNTTKVKNVVWGLIFTRDGKILIHQRGLNAKDNRGMWDKSIGGHIDLEKDVVDGTKAASREMLEELYKVESEAQGGHSKREIIKMVEDNPIYLGDWHSQIRYVFPFEEIKKNKEEIYFLRLNYNFSKVVVDSPRVLPNNKEVPVKVFADVYVFVMPEQFELSKLKNSKYKLLELHELSDCFKSGLIELEENGEIQTKEFNPTPDLKKIVTGELFQALSEFISTLRRAKINN